MHLYIKTALIIMAASTHQATHAAQTQTQYKSTFTHTLLRPEYITFGIAAVTGAGAFVTGYKYNALMNKYNEHYIKAAQRQKGYQTDLTEQAKAFQNPAEIKIFNERMKEKGLDQRSRNFYRNLSYGFGIASAVTAGAAYWLRFKNNTAARKA